MLALQIGARPDVVSISSSLEQASALRGLGSRFASAKVVSGTAIEVGIDDFLLNVRELATWTHGDSVEWDPALLQLAKGNLADVVSINSALQADSAVPGHRDSANEIALGGGWVGDLTSVQRRDLGRLISLSHGANFSVPGAGKTRVALAYAQHFRDLGEIERVLVIAPKSAFESWSSEVSECYGEEPPKVTISDLRRADDSYLVVINYERIDEAKEDLIEWVAVRPSVLVLDEAHRIKLGARGVWGSAALSIGPFARRRLILSGTPAPNGVEDLENLFSFVWPGEGRRRVRQAVGTGDLVQASRRLRGLYTRTTKRELGLPPVNTSIQPVELTPLHRHIYDSLLDYQSESFEAGDDDFAYLGKVVMYLLMAATTPALLPLGTSKYEPLKFLIPPLDPPPSSTLWSLMRDLPSYESSPKLLEARRIVAENAAAGRKTIVWATFVRSLVTLDSMLSEFEPAVVHGGTKDRESEILRFRNDNNCQVLISNPATLGEGISLHQICHDAVYVDRDFAAGKFLQSLDRIHRLGLASDQVTNITLLVAERTIDEIVNVRLAEKIRFMGTVLDDPDVRELADLGEDVGIAGLDESDARFVIDHLRHGTP